MEQSKVAEKNAQVRQRVEDADAEAQARCDEIVENILSGVNNLRSKCEQDITAHWKKFATFYDLPYTEMLDAIHDVVTGKKQVPEPAQHVLVTGEAGKRPAPPPRSAPRTARTRVGKRQMAPAPTPAVAALNDVGFNVTSVRNFQLEVALPDGTKKLLTNKDFETMDPANMKGSNLERLLAEHLGLKPMR